MNIIKFNDVVKENDDNFNEKYAGRYCFWVNCKWAVSFDDMDIDLYVEASKNDEIPAGSPGIPYLDTDEYSSYIDVYNTEKINNQINACKILNDHIGEIPLDKLKRFRTWLAEALIELADDVYDNETDSSGYDYETDKMLQYYANSMVDDTIKALTHFSGVVKPTDTKTACKCDQTAINTYTTLQSVTCDPITLYRNAIYYKMISVFSDVEFWKTKTELCGLIIRYIDGILKTGLPLSQRTDLYSLDYCDCDCVNTDDTALISILNQLKQALQYIIDGDVSNHKNFIYNSLSSWAIKLYEKMYWV